MAKKQSILYKIFAFLDILPNSSKPNIIATKYQHDDTVIFNRSQFNNELKSQLQQNWHNVGNLIRYGMSKENNATTPKP